MACRNADRTGFILHGLSYGMPDSCRIVKWMRLVIWMPECHIDADCDEDAG
jgi:hypothetical protein